MEDGRCAARKLLPGNYRHFCIFALLAALVTAAAPALADDNLRIERPLRPLPGRYDHDAYKRSASSGNAQAQRKPLEGKVEHHSTGGYVDSDQFKGTPGKARTDSGQLQGGAAQTGLQGQAGSSALQGGANQFAGQAGLNSAPLRGKTDSVPPFPLNSQRTRLPGDVSQRELELLGSYDVVVMQDRSSSMAEKEHFPGLRGERSRWQWCLDQAADLTRQTARLPGRGITLVLFSSQYDVYEHVALQQIPRIFSRHKTYIGTRLARPLAEQLDAYFARRQAGSTRPLVIAVITDGIPQDDEKLRDLIIDTTYRMRDPREISITFLQVGTEDDGRKLLRKLDDKLVKRGARYDIVKTKSFPEVLQCGLTRALIDTIQSETASLSRN